VLTITAHVVFSGFIIAAIGHLVKGVEMEGARGALLAAPVVGLANDCVRPMLVASEIPLTGLTLGPFLFLANALALGLVAAVFRTFRVRSFRSAFAAALVLTLVNLPIAMVFGSWEPNPDADDHVQRQLHPGRLCCAPSAVARATPRSRAFPAERLERRLASPGPGWIPSVSGSR
jgi:uncharacterized membrane protein YvlD (DUF360 family)